MRLVALRDPGGWGALAVAEASRRGWQTALFGLAGEIVGDAGYAFCRIAQHPTTRTAQDKEQAYQLAGRGFTLIPDLTQVRLYDDKLAQTECEQMRPFMPRTFVATAAFGVMDVGEQFGYPLLSKSAEGSASLEVRMIRKPEELEAEANKAFGDGIKTRYAHQRGYLILQEFLPDNRYDYRVCAVGTKRMMLRRHNRSEERPFASGSGKCEPIVDLDAETVTVLETADKFFEAMRTGWSGIDLVRSPDGRWKVLEVTIGWTQKAYADCRFFGTKRRGEEIWAVLCDEIEAGAFA